MCAYPGGEFPGLSRGISLAVSFVGDPGCFPEDLLGVLLDGRLGIRPNVSFGDVPWCYTGEALGGFSLGFSWVGCTGPSPNENSLRVR